MIMYPQKQNGSLDDKDAEGVKEMMLENGSFIETVLLKKCGVTIKSSPKFVVRLSCYSMFCAL